MSKMLFEINHFFLLIRTDYKSIIFKQKNISKRCIQKEEYK